MARSGLVALVAGATLGTVALGASAASATDIFTLQDTNGGDGYVVGLPGGGFDLFGSDNGLPRIFDNVPLDSLTSYTATAATAQTLSFDWTYTTDDLAGAQFDPGGYLINGTQFQVSPVTSDPLAYTSGSGHVLLTLAAGDTYGFYVYSTDSQEGRADIHVTPLGDITAPSSAAIPEPGAWALMLSGFFGLGAALRRRRAAEAAAA